MRPDDFQPAFRDRCRKTLGGYHAFVPFTLPPELPLDWPLANLLTEAGQAIAGLSGAGQLLPNPHLLIRPYLRREAILSSRIEDTHAGLDELILYEKTATEEERTPDVREVHNYIAALEAGLQRLRELPVSTRLILELHHLLMSNVRGGDASKTPGAYRRSQNWIGPPGCTLAEATFVPPPPEEIGPAMAAWERFLHAEVAIPDLIKAALLHYQFEAIHPFLDGNGRIGRLLVTLYLCDRGLLSQPLLYLSGFFDETRSDYYRLLLEVSTQGNWRGWVEYFLRGVRQQAERARRDTQHILDRREHYQGVLRTGKRVPREAHRMLDQIFASPILGISSYAREVGESYYNVQRAVNFWVRAGLLREFTGRRRNRLYLARELRDLMDVPPRPGAG